MIVAAVTAAAGGAEQAERPPVVAGYERFGRAATDSADRVESGLLLLGELGCINCHAPGEQSASHLTTKTGPILDGVGDRLDPAWLERYLASPHGVKPGTTMPDLLAAAAEPQRKQTAAALTHFLASTGTFDRDAPTNQEGNAGEGMAIHDRVGCTACHSPLSPRASPLPDHLPGADLAAKWSRASLDAFLRDPLSIRPSSRMPSPALNDQERRHVVAALLGSATESDDTSFKPDPALVAEGRRAFVQVGCANCHRLEAARDAGVEAGAEKAPALEALRVAESGCLAAAPGAGVPRYGLDAAQRGAVVAALGWLRSPAAAEAPTRERRVARTFAALNCYACHVRDGRGGTELAVATVDEDGERVTKDITRDALFTTHVKELGDEGRLPPTLTGVGDKLNPKFLREAMLNGCNDRQAYMHTRMPRWHADVVEPLAAALEQDVTTKATPPDLAGRPAHELVDAGRYLVGAKALGCVKCHSYDGDRGQSLGVIAMTRFPQRLRHEWFLAYVADPQRFRPGTRMPAAWPEGKAFFPDVADGTAAGQIESVWRYLTAADRREPAGARAESNELVPVDRPVLYRNFISGAGVRAIGVGYPEKVNVAWDADLLRLALAWKGPFIDAGRQWSGRGEGSATPLGDGLFTPDVGAVVAVIDAADAAWPKEPPRKRGARFKGYSLDAAGRPSFIWSLDGTDVTESIVPATFAGRPGLRRTVSLRRMPKKGVAVFRAAKAAKIEELSDGWLLIDDVWRLRVPGTVAAVRRADDGKTEIRYPAAWGTPSAAPGGAPGAEQSTFVEELSW